MATGHAWGRRPAMRGRTSAFHETGPATDEGLPMTTELTMSFDMRAPSFGPPPEALYAAAIEQSAWADAVGFDIVSVMEHHGSPDGYLPSPIVLASAIAARTRRVVIRIS